jgi:VIT1/CCC1 family predicted Fe2+/Mn2+ transporter
MATGEYISVKSQNELTGAEIELEKKQHARDPLGKRNKLTQVFIEKGVSPNLAEAVVRQISADRDRAVATHLREELGIDADDRRRRGPRRWRRSRRSPSARCCRSAPSWPGTRC